MAFTLLSRPLAPDTPPTPPVPWPCLPAARPLLQLKASFLSGGCVCHFVSGALPPMQKRLFCLGWADQRDVDPQGSQEPQTGPRLGPWPREPALRVCLEMVSLLELQLRDAQRSLVDAAGSAGLQGNVEQQLLTGQGSQEPLTGPRPGPREHDLPICLEMVSRLQLQLRDAQRSLVDAAGAAGSAGLRGSMGEPLLTCQGSQPALPGPRLGLRPREHALRVCLEMVSRLELQLRDAQRSLVDAAGAAGSAGMQGSVEQQLLTCQEMFMEIEQKVISLSALNQTTDQQEVVVEEDQDRDRDQDQGVVGSQQETVEVLSFRLERLKAKLLSFQQLLQDQQGEERTTEHQEPPGPPGPPEQRSVPQAERPPEAQLACSGSVQELFFSSPRNKLLRQSSLQQQKELEQELTEQKGLTRAIARQGSRARLLSREQENHAEPSPRSPPAETLVQPEEEKEEEKEEAQKKAVEESWLLPPSQVADSSLRRGDGTAGCAVITKSLKELQTYISHVRELGRSSAELLNQASPAEGATEAVEEALIYVLYGASLSLSSITNLLSSPAGEEDTAQLRLLQVQSLTAEADALGGELLSQPSLVSQVLRRLQCTQQCVDDLCWLVSVIQAALSTREKQQESLQELHAEAQKRLTELHAAFTSNQSAVHQITNELRASVGLEEQLQAGVGMQESLQQQVGQVNSFLEDAEQRHLDTALIQQATHLQSELDAQLAGVRSHCEALKSSLDLQQLYEHLLHSLEELVRLGSERLAPRAHTEIYSMVQLQKDLSSHVKFFQSLDRHFSTLQYLTNKPRDEAPQRRQGVTTDMQEEVARLQHLALEKGASMQGTLQLWSQWQDDSARLDSLLSATEAPSPSMQEGSASDEQVSEKLLVYQELRGRLEENRSQFSHMLEAGWSLQRAGCSGVGVSTARCDARWRCLHKRLEHEHTTTDRKWKLKKRFLRDFATLADWMVKARESIDKWRELPGSDEVEMDQRRDSFLQCVALTKGLQAKCELKVALMGTATQLLQLRDDDKENREESTPLSETCDPRDLTDLSRVDRQLRQVELDWSGLQTDLPVTQQALHKRWMETLTQQGALQELQAWLEAAESALEEHCKKIDQDSVTKSEISQLLRYCKGCQIEMSAHQNTLDYVNQPLQSCSTDYDQMRRYEHNHHAEEQGRLNHQWLCLQETLQTRVQVAEQQLRKRVERERRLQHINSWIADQNIWMLSAQTPVSQMELQRSIDTCQDLEEKIRQKSAALQEMRENVSDENSSSVFLSETDESIQACAALTQQTESVKQRLTETQQLWSGVANKLDDLILNTARTSQTLNRSRCPEICLQAHRRLDEQLQLLHEQTEASHVDWNELSEHVASLSDIISPAAAAIVNQRLHTHRTSWMEVSAAVAQQLQRSGGALQVWEVHAHLVASFSKRLQELKSEAAIVMSGVAEEDNCVEQVAVILQHVKVLLQRADTLQSDFAEVLQASKDLIGHLEPPAAAQVQSESRLLSRGVLQLRERLSGRLGQLQEELDELQQFGDVLQSLEEKLEVWQQRLKDGAQQSGLLEFSGLSADLDVLNELSCSSLTPGDAAARRLQRLNRRWADASARAEEACSELQTEALRRQTFEQKCESWMAFLQRMEDQLTVDVSGSYTGLRQQLGTHKRFQAELSIGHQILHSVISEALRLLQRGEVEDRSDFILKLAQLRKHWQGVVQRADQRRALVEGLVKHWHLYRRSLRKLQRFLAETQVLLPPAGPPLCSLQQLRRSLHDLQHTELLFQRYQSSFVHTMEVGRELFSMGDEVTQSRVQADLGTLQEEWDSLHSLLGRRMELTEAIIKNWERCEVGFTHSMRQLKGGKTRLKQSMTECEDELQISERFNKGNEDSLEDWAESLTELSTMKTDLSQYIIADDILLLQEQVEHLHLQWEELCLKVSLHKQEIADRLNAWMIFNEKNKELCEWLTQMENNVAHNSDLNIEEMVEKLKKDCMEEINLFSENKTHLKQLGEQLITASNKTKETEANDKLKDINDRWQHLFDHIETRVRKLKETLVTVQQLDKNMSNLRTWLSRIEAELAKPVVYNVCHSEEIQRKMVEQQDLQRDIEQHTESVASVLTLCDVLLHDADVCASDSENDSIQQTTRSLDRRWRNICAMSMERRMRIEETWRLWCKFLDDYSRFEDWLKTAELTAASPESADVLYTTAKEELKKFETFQRQVHERLTQLELVNKQYRRLARENRTDAASRLKVMVHDGNQRWDALQRRVAAVLRRLKHFTSQREDFEGTREGILVWLTEMDLQLTNVEHFSESDIEDKMRQLDAFKKEILLNTNKIDALIVFGENLIQKSAPLDAMLIEDELEELHSYCQEVFGRVARFHHRLIHRRPDLEDHDTDLDEAPELANEGSWTDTTTMRRKGEDNDSPAVGGLSAGRQVMCHLLPPPLEQSGRETPVSVDSIPLEWDHTVDVGGSSSHEDDEEATYFSALSDVRVTERSESFGRATVRAVKAASVKSAGDSCSWQLALGSPERKRVPRELMRGLSSSPTHTSSTPFHRQGYVKLMSECSGSIDSVKRVKLILNDEEELEDGGLTSSTANKQTSTAVIERWELLQAQNTADVTQDLAQWQKLNSDLCDVTSWLGRVLPELERLQRIAPSTGVRDIEANIRKLKDMQKTFNSYKCLMISVNLSSRHFLRGDSVEQRELQEALSSANHGWTQACGGLESWEMRLHAALMQCQEFHETLHAMLLWLAQAENKLHSVNVADPSLTPSVLMQHRDTLTALQEELRGHQQQVSSLQEISSQLLLEATAEDSVEAKEKVHVIGNKLHLLLRQAAADLRALQQRLGSCSETEVDGPVAASSALPPQQEESTDQQAATRQRAATSREERGDSAPRRPFLSRVLRAALPLHLLLLMLLLLVCLVPLSEGDYSCTLTNNFARSFYPMLHYTNGPPPT